MSKNVTNNQEIKNDAIDTRLAWEVPVLYKEDWLNTLKTTPGAETPSNADGQS